MCPQNPPEGVPEKILHLPGLSKDKIWRLVNEAYDVLSKISFSQTKNDKDVTK